MIDADDVAARTLALAQRVSNVLAEHDTKTALIGAGAMAVHGYPRNTDDLDLAVEADFTRTLLKVRRALEEQGLAVEARAADPGDPLGGVLDVEGSAGEKVQIVNYNNDFGRGAGLLAFEAIEQAAATDFGGGVELRVVDVPYLVALKLYAGGPKAFGDVAELLASNAERVTDIEAVCEKHGFRGKLEKVRALAAEL